MKQQKIIINKHTGSVITVYSDNIEPMLDKISNKESRNVKRVSNIEFNNENKLWEAIDVLNKKVIKSSDTKKQTYEQESKWADENLVSLSELHFEKNTSN